ncbi:glycosyltransferase [Proteus hauseri]|uniref:glycosyltransferase n=1 Tax=Proteus hauseri TaxID=183417 RepID=UPI0032DA429D
MRILHLINLQGFGGAERLFIEYLKNSSFNNEILCVSNNINKNIEPELARFKINFVNKFAFTSIKYPSFLRKFILKKKIEKSKSDITIVWDFVPRISYKPKNTTLVYYDHGCSWQFQNNNKTQYFFSILDSAIAVSNASKRVMELRFNPKFNINVVVNRLPYILNKKIHYLKDGIITLGVAARLVGLKGIGIAIITLKELQNKNIKAKLIIAGDGEQKENLERLSKNLGIQDSIEFLGYQSDMTSFYSKIDIYLSTPILEAFGLSCIEALSNGVPVIFPILNGQPEAVKDGYCGVGITPTLSIDEYHRLTGLNIDFSYDVYDPILDKLTEPKFISPHECVNNIIEIMNNYESYSNNAINWSKKATDYKLFVYEFENCLNKLPSQTK